MDYLPEYLHEFREFEAIFEVEDAELDKLKAEIVMALESQFILSAPIERIELWERFLGINAVGSIENRRAYILSLFRGGNKLNEQSIKDIVMALSGNAALVSFRNSVIEVRVLAPKTLQFLFSDIERTLRPRIPAHLDISVMKHYGDWQDVKDWHKDWAEIKNELENWNELRRKIYIDVGLLKDEDVFELAECKENAEEQWNLEEMGGI